jgi:membrane protein implicated in regulation of membrane protease activity
MLSFPHLLKWKPAAGNPGPGHDKGCDMTVNVQYWHWLVFGMILIMAEIFVPSFTIFWFGLGGLVVAGVMLLAAGISLTWQLFIWAIASCMFTFLWFKFIRPLMTDRTRAGISREAAIGETGQVIRDPSSGRRGLVRFATPLLGSEEWPFITHSTVSIGDRVTVVDISGNTLVVKKT